MHRFSKWFDSFANSIALQGCEVEVEPCQDSPNAALRMDIGTPSLLARLVVWDSGDYDVEVIDAGSGDNIYRRNGHVDNEADLANKLAELLIYLDRELGKTGGVTGKGENEVE